jgi:DNA invertase Pin-like site-specific DNA recombinase
MNDQSKVTADHLRRDAYLYVRQSSLYQVANNTESSRRQYDPRGRAVALGRPADSVIVIDVDQGQSGASAADRAGFQRLVADVSLGKAGIVLGLECSRLARNNADWHRLLELCSLSGTLICDEDGLYDPGSINDHLLLGLKGTISEAELHFIRARLQGGLLAKAARGELRIRLPVGLCYDQLGNVTLDPDLSVRAAIEYLFKCFEQTGSAHAVVKQFAAEGLQFPGRHGVGSPHAGELYWKPLRHDMVLFTLHNPRYAGAYFYGRRKTFTDIDGHTRTVLKPRDQWTVLINDAHPGYVTFEQYEHNQQTLAANAAAHSDEEHRGGPDREGPALLQGLVVCGKCGKRMTVNYHKRCNGELVPNYHCSREGIATGTPPCQTINGAGVDDAIATLVLEQLTPFAIEAALAVSTELAQRAADASRRRYLAVDPTNRLVADQLEADWNNKLRELADAKDQYERATQAGNRPLTDEQQARIRALATDLPALWQNPATPMRERKRLIRLLLTDVTLIDAGEQITAHIRLSGGQQHTLQLPRPLRAWEQHTTPPTTISLIDQLLDDHTYDETVEILNQRGLTGGWGKPFTVVSLTQLCRLHGIPSHQQLRAAGMLTLEEIAEQFGVTTGTVKRWQHRGQITGRRIDGRRAHLYHAGQNRPPDRRQRRPDTASQAAAASRHHHPSPIADSITTTNTPGGAV